MLRGTRGTTTSALGIRPKTSSAKVHRATQQEAPHHLSRRSSQPGHRPKNPLCGQACFHLFDPNSTLNLTSLHPAKVSANLILWANGRHGPPSKHSRLVSLQPPPHEQHASSSPPFVGPQAKAPQRQTADAPERAHVAYNAWTTNPGPEATPVMKTRACL